jgi:tetratricopeptide (TPR) repeat protein
MQWNPVTWLTLVPLAIVGIWYSRTTWRTQLFLYVYSVGFALSIILVFAAGRYRLPETLPMLIWTGPAVTEWLADVRRRNWGRSSLVIVCFIAGIVGLWPTWSPLAKAGTPSSSAQLVRAEDFLAIAGAHYALGQKEKACDLLEEALREYPTHPIVVKMLAQVYGEKGLHQKAVALMEQAVRSGHADADTAIMLARIYAFEGRRDQATALLQGVLKSEPQNADALSLLQELRR